MYYWDGADLIFDVHVQPRASRDEVVGMLGDKLKVRITAPPVDGKANQHLIAFFAKLFQVSKSSVVLLKGETGREKRFRIQSPRCLPENLQRN
jgi:uncharacterized protein